MRRLLASLLVLAYLFALVMSTGHLSEWYRLTLGNLPTWFAIGLAAALESSAFLLSLLSNSLLRGSAWAAWGSLIALGLVWVGNFFSMVRAGEATGIPTYEVFLASLFVPVSTYVVAKVLGELLEKDVRAASVHTAEAKVNPEPTPVHSRLEEALSPSVNSQPEEVSPSPEVNPGFTEAPKEPGRSFRGTREVYLSLLREPKTAKELMEHLGVSKAAVYKQLRALEAKGLVVNREGKWQAVDGGVKA
jgi:DNA-binding transcriptional ArsR family regulator